MDARSSELNVKLLKVFVDKRMAIRTRVAYKSVTLMACVFVGLAIQFCFFCPFILSSIMILFKY